MIGYYIHHHGRGHRTRAARIAGHLSQPVVGLSSLPRCDGPFAGWVQLPPDDRGVDVVDPAAGGALHWAPRHDDGVRRRMACLADWIDSARPAALVVDVSVEAALLARLMAVPVVVVALPGDRDDAPHQSAYRLAERIIACWPRTVYDPPWLAAHADRTVHVGGMSRFDGRLIDCDPVPGSVLLMGGTGGTMLSAHDVMAAQQATPSWTWSAIGQQAERWVADPWDALCRAEVVVIDGGQNSVAEVAAARRPAVIVAQERPFDEQVRMAAALDAAEIAVGVPSWPRPAEWPGLLERARLLPGSGWTAWSGGDAAVKAAAAITEVAS